MQCRVFCAQLDGQVILPGPKYMFNEALGCVLKNKRRFVDRRRHTLQVFYVTYMDSLARIIGVRPQIPKYWLSDPRLATRLIFHGLVPYQYRLEGPHQWTGARDAIMGMEERVFESTRTRKTEETKRSRPISKVLSLRMFI